MAFKPGHVKTGGRKAGTPNKRTIALVEAAGQYTAEALGVIVSTMRQQQDGELRLRAAAELLNRAVGRPAQALHLGDARGDVIDWGTMDDRKIDLLIASLQRFLAESGIPVGEDEAAPRRLDA